MIEILNVIAWSAAISGLGLTYLFKQPKLGYGLVLVWGVLIVLINYLEGRVIYATIGVLLFFGSLLLFYFLAKRDEKHTKA